MGKKGQLQKFLTDILGEDGFETLEKGIFKRSTQAAIDPLEYALYQSVAPRSLLSWLVHNLKPMQQDEIKDFKFPGFDDIKINIQKQGPDQYRGEFVQKGKVIHSFEKQSLPVLAGHFQTTLELYDDLDAPEKEKGLKKEAKSPNKEDSEDADANRPSFDMPKAILAMNSLGSDPEKAKWEFAHANVKELTSVIGKLVDALVAKKAESTEKTEIKGDPQKVESSEPPKETAKPTTLKELNNIESDQGTPESKEVKHKEGLIKEAKSEILEKPYHSEAQRRWAHTKAGTKALGGKAAVHEWDQATKGKHIPEKVSKNQYFRNLKKAGTKEQPGGAAMPVAPAQPKFPAPAVSPSANPKGAQNKSALKTGYFQTQKQKLKPQQKFISVHKSELSTKCEHCNKAQFVIKSSGPSFTPCSCFMVLNKNERPFVRAEINKDIAKLFFDPQAEVEQVKAFLLTIKRN